MKKPPTRRAAVATCVATAFGLTAHTSSTHAALPVLLQLLGIAARILIGNGIRWAAKVVAPWMLSTATRRFLFGVAVAYGISQAQAAVVAEQAERAGAETVARGDVHHDVVLSLSNTKDQAIVFRSMRVELVNLGTDAVEEVLPLTMVNVPAGRTIELPFTVKRFAGEGLRQLRLVAGGQTLAVGPKFWGFV